MSDKSTDADAILERICIQHGNDPGFDDKAFNQYMDVRNKLGITLMSDVQREQVEWLWYPRIPLRKVTLIEGDPGIGKSTLTYAIATAQTLGLGLPGQPRTEPRRVLLLSAEDGLGDVARPKLEDLGADLDLVEAVEKPISLDVAGCTDLHNFIKWQRPGLVIIDPIFAWTGPRADVGKQSDSRSIMDRLSRLAAHHRCAILAIRHLTKGDRSKNIYRGGGSIEWTAAARSVLLVGADPGDSRRKAIVQIKNNLAPLAEPTGFEIVEGRFAWTGKTSVTASQILSNEKDAAEDATSLQEAVDFLNEMLSAGPALQEQITKDASQAGIADRTLRRAKSKLECKSRKQRSGGKWTWELP